MERPFALAHASTDYINRYIETHYVTLRCHLSAVEIGTCEIHDPQRQTFENVFLIYKTARFTPKGLQATGQRYEIKLKVARKREKYLEVTEILRIFAA